MSPHKALTQTAANRSKRGAAAQAAAVAAAGGEKELARTAGERSPLNKDLQPAEKSARGAEGSVPAARGLFPAPQVAPAAPAAKPAARAQPQQNEDETDDRVFSTPSGGNAKVPARFTGEDAFAYIVGFTGGAAGEKFNDVYDPAVYAASRLAMVEGWSNGSAMHRSLKDGKVDTPELREGRAGRVEKADIQDYIEKAKAGSKLSGLIKQHVFCDHVTISYEGTKFQPSRPFFFRLGEEGELKALVSHYLKSVLGDAYSPGDFLDAWESGCSVEVATKARKADLTGMDPNRVKTTVKTVTLKAEIRIMYNNARATLVAKVWAVYREVNDLPPRPKGEQNKAGKKATKIEDQAWEVHAKQMQVLAANETSRYGAPYMEGKFNDNPDEDCSTDPVGQVTAVRALSIIFKGVNVEETKLREQLSQGQLLEFRMVEIALFSTVLNDKIRLVRRGATCTTGTFDDEVKKSINFFVKKFERYGWTNNKGGDSGPALTKLIKISDYPVPAGGRPLLAEDDPAYFIDDDGFQVEKGVPLAGEVEAEEQAAQQQVEGEGQAPAPAAAENGGGGRGRAQMGGGAAA